MIVAVIDDEQHCTDRILALLKTYAGDMNVVTYDTVETAVKGINAVLPDIVFLDVQIHEQTGFDILKATQFHNFSLIFTTAYEQYAIEAFKFSAIDYLLKPIAAGDFSNALQRAIEKKEQKQLAEKLDILLSNISTNNMSKKMSIPTSEGYVFLNISDIVRCQADVNYTHIFTVEQKKYTVSRTLKQFEELLSAHNFFRIHNSHMINLDYIKKYVKSGFVTLTDNTVLEVSIRKREAFLNKIGKL